MFEQFIKKRFPDLCKVVKARMEINVFNVLISCGVVQGLIFSSVVFIKKHNEKPYFYLASLVLVLSLSNLYYWFRDTGIDQQISYFSYFYIPYDLLILPLFYFFTTAYCNTKRQFDRLLLIPFFIRLLAQFFIVIYTIQLHAYVSIPEKVKFVLKYIDAYATFLFMAFTTLLLFRSINNYEKSTNEAHKVAVKWIRQLLYFGLILCSVFLASLVMRNTSPGIVSHHTINYCIWIGLSILIYWLGYAGIHHLGLFTKSANLKYMETGRRLKKSELKEQRFEELNRKIREEKLYRDPTLSLSLLSEQFNLSEGYISQLINAYSTTNFTNYINRLRVEEAKKLLVDSHFTNYTIVAISLESGFNSKSAFYTAFKKETGISPSEFQKNNLS